MNRNRMSQIAKRTGRIAVVCLLAVFLFLVFTDVSQAENPPTVNGLFYGDGDYDRYVFYSISDRGSKLYYRLEGSALYVALVVGREVNDNVFGNAEYMIDAGWPSANPRNARRLIDSEYMEFTMSACGQNWTWRQGYGRQPGVSINDSTFTDPTWVSNETIETGSGAGTAPPGYVSSSSWVANLNNYANNYPANPFDMGVNGSAITNWKSAFDENDPDSVVGLEGYPATGPITYNSTYQWEWPIVYEWSVPLTFAGCAGSTVVINAVSSHHSPAKTGGDNDPFPPPPNDGVLTDFGDLPEPYATLYADDGARHIVVIGGAYLGNIPPDVEPDGYPSVLATGDDAIIPSPDDEDGVLFLSGFTWSGLDYTALIEVTAGTDGCLSAFMDINGDGILDQVYLEDGTPISDLCIDAGIYTWTIRVDGTEGDLSPTKYARFRFTNEAGQGGASPTGLASTGEIEDYLIASPTAITLRNVSTSGSSAGLAAVLVLALVGLGLTSLYMFNRRERAA
jgi:hypothetical protein